MKNLNEKIEAALTVIKQEFSEIKAKVEFSIYDMAEIRAMYEICSKEFPDSPQVDIAGKMVNRIENELINQIVSNHEEAK